MITDVHHVGIAVSDMAEALRFYSEALGLPVVKEGEAPARGARVALIAVGGSYLELVQPVGDDSLFARHIKERGEGLHHVALRVLEPAFEVGVDGLVLFTTWMPASISTAWM